MSTSPGDLPHQPTQVDFSEAPTRLQPGDETPSPVSDLQAAARPPWPTVKGYEIEGELGHGGMGIVYQARQVGLNRQVALKMIRAGDTSPANRARFRLEAEAVARLQHPHIVQIYEVGEQDGMPFFSLELAAGGSLARAVAGTPQPPRQAAQLIETVARAIHYAHERGIIHRDLKPANILLQIADFRLPIEKPTLADPALKSSIINLQSAIPKITDFGLAKLLDADRADQTCSGVLVGTPSYMAPEQGSGRSGAVGVPADVYALGAVLYELLTGRPPFRAESALDTLEQVRTQEPVSPCRLQPKVPRDLQTICLKSLEKIPHRRYATAQDLADDLRRFLAGEPIKARAASALERGIKWARRRPALTALGIVLIAAVATVLTVVLVANSRLVQERNLAESRRLEAEDQERRARTHLRLARAAVDRMLTRVGYDRLAPVPYMETVRRDLLNEALQLYRELVRSEGDDPKLRQELGQSYLRLATISTLLGENPQAEQGYKDAAAVQRRLAAEFPSDPQHRQDLAVSLGTLGKHLSDLSRFADAEPVLQEAVQEAARLMADYPESLAYQQTHADSTNLLGLVFQNTGRGEMAGEAYRQAVELLQKVVASAPAVEEYQRSLAECNTNLAVYLATHGHLAEAEKAFRRDIEYWETQRSRYPERPNARIRLARGVFNLGYLLAENGRPSEGEPFVRRSVEQWQGLAAQYPKVPSYHALVGQTLRQLGLLVTRRKDFAAAGGLFEQAVAAFRTALNANPGNKGNRNLLGDTYYQLGGVKLQLGAHREAAAAASESAKLLADRGELLFPVGCLLARCVPAAEADMNLPSDQRRTAAAEYGRQAVDVLRQARGKGFEDMAALQKEKALDPLRSREDFQQLLTNQK